MFRLPELPDFRAIPPVADCQPGQVGRSQRRRLPHLWPYDRDAEEVGLELHQQIVGGSAAIHPQFGQRGAGIRFHRFEEVGRLEGDTLQGGPGNVPGSRAAGDAEQGASGIRVPVGGAQTGKGRD